MVGGRFFFKILPQWPLEILQPKKGPWARKAYFLLAKIQKEMSVKRQLQTETPFKANISTIDFSPIKSSEKSLCLSVIVIDRGFLMHHCWN